jgi:hypothetical protein
MSVRGRGRGRRDGGIQSMQGLVRTVAVVHAARSSERGPPTAAAAVHVIDSTQHNAI